MKGNVKIGVALVGGYLLGRTKKAKMAIGFGMFLAGKKLSFDPRELGKLVADSPVLGTLNDQVRKELMDATKSAATNALTQRASGLADSLHQRTQSLEGKDVRAENDEADADGDEEEKPAPRRRPAAKRTAKRSTKPAAKATSGARKGGGGNG